MMDGEKTENVCAAVLILMSMLCVSAYYGGLNVLSKEEAKSADKSMGTAHSLPDVFPLRLAAMLGRTSGIETESINSYYFLLLR